MARVGPWQDVESARVGLWQDVESARVERGFCVRTGHIEIDSLEKDVEKLQALNKRQSSRQKRRAFSLIELLINIAIIACLASIVGPLYRDYIKKTMVTKAEQDLDVIVSAISRCETLETKLNGTSLDPIVGRYLSVLPLDPWGNDYAFDGFLCCVGTFGGDGVIYSYADDDVIRQYNKYLTPVRVRLQGSFGPPKQGEQLIILTSKPFMMVSGSEGLCSEEIELVKPNGDRYPVHELGYRFSFGQTNGYERRLVLQCNFPHVNTARISMTQSDTINFSPMMFSLSDFAAPSGPYDLVADTFRYGPVPYSGRAGGLPIERMQ